MINDFPYLCCAGPMYGAGGVVVLCAMCVGGLISRGDLDFMNIFMHVRLGGSVGVCPCIVWLNVLL
jgi:hypothetical protein